MALFSPCHADGRNNGQKILGALSIGLVDSAFIYLGDAVKKGLPDDSLYYLWSEIYIARGILDTALALSIAGQRSDRGTLTKTLLTQRYNIYLALGLKKDADELLDTIMGSAPPLVNPYLPRISINGGLGYNQRNSFERHPYPFINEPAGYERIPNKGADFALNSSWFLQLKNGAILVPGLSYTLANGVERTELDDTLNHALGVSLDLKNFRNHLSLGYALQERISMFGDLSTVNTATLSRSAVSTTMINYSSLIYSIELDDDSKVLYQALWLMHYLTRPLTPKINLAILPLITCFLTDDLNSSYTSSVMYIEDPNADTVRHYTDASCTQLIPIPDPFTIIDTIFLIRRYKAASDPLSVSLNAPESYCGITPAVGLEFELPHGFSIEGTLKGMVNYYLKEHTWTSYTFPYTFARYDGAWLAYSRSDGNYYVVDELGNIFNAEHYSGPLDIKQHRVRRIDLMIGGELLLERRLWNSGTVGLNGYVRKYRSTLNDDLPVKIKDLFYGGGISLRIYFGAMQPLSAL
jgi:hypothetical protein